MLTIGRSPHSDLFLDDVTVSRHHARVLRDEGGFWVEDLNSLNGTYVNRKRIERHRLFDGDELQIGKFKLAFLEQSLTMISDELMKRRRLALLTIGQVVDQLKPDFPDLSITKVRYLEDRGLLAPSRTPGRYRKYSRADVRRLRTILTLQRDQYLPLEVIRERVDGPVRRVLGQHSAAVQPPAAAVRISSVKSCCIHKRRSARTPAWTRHSSGCSSSTGSSTGRRTAGPVFTESDLEIARICQLLVRFGVEPRNLRLLGSSVEREAALVEQITTPSLRLDPRRQARVRREDAGGPGDRSCPSLMHLLLYKELRKLL